MVWVRRAILVLVGLLVLVALVWAFVPKPLLVETAKVRRGPLTVTVDAEAKTRVRDRFTISAPLPGRIERIALKPGDIVKSGDVLVMLYATPAPLLDKRARQQADAAMQAAEAARRQAEARQNAAKAAFDFAKWDVERSRTLAKTGDLPEASLRQAEMRYLSAIEEQRSAQFGVQIADFQLVQARMALVHTQELGAGDSLPIRAPAAGRVLRVFQENAANVSPAEPLLEVADVGSIEIVADLLSTDAVRIEPGADATVEHWGGEGALKAKVRLIEPSGFTKVSALGVEEQRVNVILEFSEPKEKLAALGDAFRVEIRIVVWHKDNVLKAPSSALFRKGSGFAMYKIEDGRAKLVEVSVGRRTALETELERGDEGAEVIVHPADTISDGVAVKTE